MAVEISVVIPTWERAAALEGCLLALAAQTLARDRFEVIVCDDGSRAPIADALEATLRTLQPRLAVRIVRQRNAGPAAARNRAAAAADGRWLAFTDDDCRPAPDWLERLLAHFALTPDVLIGGGLRTQGTADRYALATQAIMDFVYADQERRGGVRLFSTSNLALPAAGFARLGGFSGAFLLAAGEDYDLCARWQASGGAALYAPDAVIVHEHALTLAGFCRQHFTYGRGLLRMRRRMRNGGSPVRGTGSGRSPLFYARLVLSPLRRGPRGASTALLTGVAQAATLAGVLREKLGPGAPPPGGLENWTERTTG
jgi:glycosyltransferase involved in cell wall biosynthesis